MSDDAPRDSGTFRREVEHKARRMRRARQVREPGWRGLAAGASLGWSLVVPMLAGALLARAVLRWTGSHALSLACLGLGLVAASVTVWRQIRSGLKGDDE